MFYIWNYACYGWLPSHRILELRLFLAHLCSLVSVETVTQFHNLVITSSLNSYSTYLWWKTTVTLITKILKNNFITLCCLIFFHIIILYILSKQVWILSVHKRKLDTVKIYIYACSNFFNLTLNNMRAGKLDIV